MLDTKTRNVWRSRRLTLRKETLRELGRGDLRNVVGGDNSTGAPCGDPRHTVMLPEDGTDVSGGSATTQ
jgi:hypothetical protein